MHIKHYSTFSVFRVGLLEQRCKKDHTVVGLGASRGGTSVVSYTLAQAGMPMGKTNNLNHEDEDILQNIRRKKELSKIFASRNEEFGTWGFKLPAATFLVDWLDGELRDPVFIFVIRNIASVARSVLKHDPIYGKDLRGYGASMKHAIRYYDHITSAIERIESPVIMVELERALSKSDLFVDELFTTLDMDVDDETTALIKSQLRQPGYKPIVPLKEAEPLVTAK